MTNKNNTDHWIARADHITSADAEYKDGSAHAAAGCHSKAAEAFVRAARHYRTSGLCLMARDTLRLSGEWFLLADLPLRAKNCFCCADRLEVYYE